MLLDTDSKKYNYYFPTDPHLFVSEKFTSLNASKADRIVRLVDDTNKVQIGLVGGIKDGILKSPFSAPFGGFHFKNRNIYPSAIQNYVNDLANYARKENLKEIRLTIPPDIYSQSFNTKVINALLRMDFKMEIPEITNWLEISKFDGNYSHQSSRTYYKQSVKNDLTFNRTENIEDKHAIYDLVKANRARMDRPIYMTFNDLLDVGKLFETDYLKVSNPQGEIVAGAIFYREHPQIAFAVFWGDSTEGRPLRAMDFLIYNLWDFYKNKGFKYIDLGISTVAGVPNEGLLRFKETHECKSALRYSFTWKNAHN